MSSFLAYSAVSQRTSITWEEVKQRAADRPKWVWYVPDLLDNYKEWKIEMNNGLRMAMK